MVKIAGFMVKIADGGFQVFFAVWDRDNGKMAINDCINWINMLKNFLVNIEFVVNWSAEGLKT